LPRREPQPRSPSCRTSFDEYITGAKDGRVTDGSLPDGRPEAKAVDTANRAVKEKLARDQADDSPVERAVKSHPIGVAAGAVGMAAGAVAGIAARRVGSLFGALDGAVLGGAMGSGGSPAAGAPIDSPAWREHHATLAGAAPYDQYENAYRLGDAAQRAYGRERRWKDLESAMETDWPRPRGSSGLSWEEARGAARSAWDAGTSGKVLNRS
jgi:hypothetical protein